MSLLLDLNTPIVFAHRGASASAPENTLAAFNLAVEQGAPAIELDAKLSADNRVVVIHDPTIDRTTDGHGKVNELSLAELQALDAGSWFDAGFAGERIPTLDEVFEEVGRQVLINVELTNYTSPRDDLPELAVGLVNKHGLQNRVLFSSFHPLNLRRVRKALPEVPIGLLALPGAAGSRMRGWLGRFFSPHILHPHFSDVDDQLVTAERRRGRRLHVWTVNQRAEIERLAALGVEGLFCDDPVAALQVLEAV